MTGWLGEAAAVERARELLRELDDSEAGAWSAWAWERPDDGVAELARIVSHRVELLRGALRHFAAEHELTAARKERAGLPGRPQPLTGDDEGESA